MAGRGLRATPAIPDEVHTSEVACADAGRLDRLSMRGATANAHIVPRLSASVASGRPTNCQANIDTMVAIDAAR